MVGSAFTHGSHPALDQRKSAALRQHIRGGFGVEYLIIRIAPEAKFVAPRGAFTSEQIGCAGSAADPVADPGETRRDQFALGENLFAVPHRVDIGEQPPVAIGGKLGPAQCDHVAADQRVERVAGLSATRR